MHVDWNNSNWIKPKVKEIKEIEFWNELAENKDFENDKAF